ncbi:MAG TPA: hypothetical protein PLK08_00810 [Phycisphaerae bacterium]|nr:hypothetical protein [Phycisphaerae bacterium]
MVYAQGRILKVKVPHSSQTANTPGLRGKIIEFSAQSRKRMIDLLARIDTDNAGFVCFITLTYPDLDGPPSHEITERDRRTFLKRIARRFPESSAIWRREHEPRKSGEQAGAIYPHYHMLFFGMPFFDCDELNAIWREIMNYPDYVRTEIKGIKSWRQAMYYLSKYMAKIARQGDGSQPDGQAPAGEAGTDDGGNAAGSLVYGTYLTGDNKINNEPGKKLLPVGRAWGVFNRHNLPLAELHSASLPAGQWMEAVKDAAAQVWPGVNAVDGYGFTLFLDNPTRSKQWFDGISKLANVLPLKPDDGIPF